MNQLKMTENLKINFVFNIVYQVVAVLSPLVVTPKISRVFGVDYIGIKSYTFSIVYYFAIFGVLGLDMLGQRRVALVKDDINLRSREFWIIYSTRFILVLISSLGYVGYTFIAPLSQMERTVSFCWIIYLFREMINPIWFLQGIEKYRLLSILGIISQVSYVLCTVIFVNYKNDLPLYIIFYTLIPLLISFCYFPPVLKSIVFIRPERKEMFSAVKESVIYFIPTVATAIYSMVDKTMLGLFDPQKISTGLYESAERLVKVALAISTASFTIMRTRMSYLYGKRDPHGYAVTTKKFTSFSLMLCWPIMFGIIGISKDFVPIFFGEGFEEVIGLSYIFSLVIPCLTVSGLLQAVFIFPYGLQKTMDIYYGIIVSINVVMNLVLISIMGTVGAIISSVFAEMLLAVILVFRARRSIDVKHIATGSIKYITASVVMLFVMKYISSVVLLNSISKVAIEFIVAIAVYFTVCIVLQEEFVISQLKSFFIRIREIR